MVWNKKVGKAYLTIFYHFDIKHFKNNYLPRLNLKNLGKFHIFWVNFYKHWKDVLGANLNILYHVRRKL